MIKNGYRHFIVALTMITVIGCTTTGEVDTPVRAATETMDYTVQGENQGSYWPTNGWRTCVPEAVGMDTAKLNTALAYAATPAFNTEGIVVVKNGYIVAEAYMGNFKKDQEHISHSMAKSFTSALIGIAIDKGLLAGVDEKLCRFYENWGCDDPDDYRSRITLRHAMTLTTGLEWYEDWTKEWNFKTMDTLKMMIGGHYYGYMSQRPGIHEPGQHFYYSTGDPMLLTKVIQDATGATAFEFAQENLFKPLHIDDVRWDHDLDGYTSTAGGMHTSVRSYAKFGYLYLNRGHWEDRQIVSEQWVAASTQTDPSVNMWDAYGYLWHVNLPVRLSGNGSSTDTIPADGFMAQGVQGQTIIIIPSKDLLIVKVASQRKVRMDLARLVTLVIDADK